MDRGKFHWKTVTILLEDVEQKKANQIKFSYQLFDLLKLH